METCGRCHARRAQIWSDYEPGQPLAQTYRVAFLEAALYHADGQMREEVYEYGSFLQSKMYHAGVTCSDCHDPHSARLRAAGNAVCAQCHLPAKYDGPQHHFHPATPRLPSVSPATCCNVSIWESTAGAITVFGSRGPTYRSPWAPPTRARTAILRGLRQWAAEAVAQWYGPQRQGGWHYGERA